MSAAVQLACLCASATLQAAPHEPAAAPTETQTGPSQAPNLAFYRKHTERMLRRYLYASMLVGRAPSLLRQPLGRGWASSRPVRTFEDAVIFVLDIETCLKQLDDFERELLSRIVLQEYSMEETARMLRVTIRTASSRLGKALDRLTRNLLDAGLLVLPC